MSAAKWWEGPIGALDTETTGTDPHTDRIVTAAIVHTSPGHRPRSIQWLIHPDRDIPTEAADVHGWTLPRLEAKLNGATALRITDQRETPMHADGALMKIAAQCATIMHAEAPLVAANAAYDLTLLETELARVGIDPLTSRPTGIRGVVDPMVLEKQWDPFRKTCYKSPGCLPKEKLHECSGCRGGRHKCGGCGSTDKTLGSLARHYGLRLPAAHAADADALVAIRLSVKMASLWPDIARLKLSTLATNVAQWRSAQALDLRDYWKRTGDERWREVCGEFPVHKNCAPALVGGEA